MKVIKLTPKAARESTLVGLVAEGMLRVIHDFEYVGPVGTPERKRVELPLITRVQFKLSPREWCALCMRDGDKYVGGCCGQTSAIQDIFQEIFRDGGSADACTVRELMAAASKHEGFELYSDGFDASELPALGKNWDKLGPVEKIGLSCQAVKDKFATTRLDRPPTRSDEPEDFLEVLRHSLDYLSFRRIFGKDPEKKSDGQFHANQELLLARAIPAARKFLEAAVPVLSKPFKGAAIVVRGTEEIQSNNVGFCIYQTREDAQKVLDLWKKGADEARDDEKAELFKALGKFEIRPLSISADGGIVWEK